MTTPETRIVFLALLIAALVLALDLILPLSVAVGVLYLPIVLLGIWLPRRRHVVALAALASLLTVLGHFLSDNGGGSVEWAMLTNRALAFLVIWTSASFLILHKGTEGALRRSEEKFRKLADGSLEGIIVQDNLVLRYANNALARIFKYDSPSDLLALPNAMELWAPAERTRMRELYEACMRGEAGPTEIEVEGLCKDGSRLWLRISAQPIDWEGRRLPSAAVTDISEYKRLQDELASYAQLFDRWKNSNFIGIIQSNADGAIIDANDTMLGMLGYSRQDLLDGSLDWTKLTPPEFLHLDELAIQEAAVKGFWTPFEKEYIHKDGHRVPVMIGGAQYKESPAEGIGFIVDLTEIRRLERQVSRAQKMDAIGQLTGA